MRLVPGRLDQPLDVAEMDDPGPVDGGDDVSGLQASARRGEVRRHAANARGKFAAAEGEIQQGVDQGREYEIGEWPAATTTTRFHSALLWKAPPAEPGDGCFPVATLAALLSSANLT